MSTQKTFLSASDCGCTEEVKKKIIICDKPAPAPAPVVQVAPPAPAPVQTTCQPAPQAQQMILVLPQQQATCTTTTGGIPVTTSPPATSFNPHIAPCDYHPDCCWWGSEVFPKSFFINSQQNAGRDYVIIQGLNGGALQCDCDGNASISNGISVNNYFIPEHIGGKVVALRSYFGGYLAIQADGSVNCADHAICERNNFQVVLSSYDCAQDAPNYALLRVISGNYLSINNGQVTSVANIDETAVFKGYLFDKSTSVCQQPPVTSPPVETPPVEQKNCREIEIEVPAKKHKKKKAAKKEEVEEITTTTVQHRKVKPKKRVVREESCEDEEYEDEGDDDQCEYEEKKKGRSRKHKKSKKSKSAEYYDSDDVIVLNNNKESGADDSCKDGKAYTIVEEDDDAKKCD